MAQGRSLGTQQQPALTLIQVRQHRSELARQCLVPRLRHTTTLGGFGDQGRQRNYIPVFDTQTLFCYEP
jgi:hypothetical protein